MKKVFKSISTFVLLFAMCFAFVACGSEGRGNNKTVGESVELSSAMLGEIQFDNSDTVRIEQNERDVKISGKIDAMSKSQKNAFGVDDATHVVALKLTFDKERTIASFKIQGDIIKVYSDEKNVDNYVGSISDLLDNESGEDSYCNLILSANTKEYKLITEYSDGHESVLNLKIEATLASSSAE